MKILISVMILFVLPVFSLQAAQDRVVTSLNMDECWVGEMREDSPLKVAHFGASQTWQMGPSDFDSLLAHALDKMALHGINDSEKSLETLLHCSSYAASVVLNIKTPETRVCLWGRFDGDSFKVERWGVEPMAHNGHCTGAVPGDLILSVGPKSDYQDIKNELIEYGIWDDETDLRTVTSGVFAVSLSKKFWFKEESIIQMLEKQKSRSQNIRAAELNFYPHSVGEFLKLDELSGEL